MVKKVKKVPKPKIPKTIDAEVLFGGYVERAEHI